MRLLNALTIASVLAAGCGPKNIKVENQQVVLTESKTDIPDAIDAIADNVRDSCRKGSSDFKIEAQCRDTDGKRMKIYREGEGIPQPGFVPCDEALEQTSLFRQLIDSIRELSAECMRRRGIFAAKPVFSNTGENASENTQFVIPEVTP